MKPINILGAFIGAMAFGYIWYWYEWKLALVIFLAIMGNNMERSGRK